MPPVTRTEQEEADFMNELLGGTETSLLDSASTQPVRAPATSLGTPPTGSCSAGSGVIVSAPTTPKKPRPAPITIHDVDLEQLLEGAEDWDWDDMNSDIMSPKKSPTKSPQKSPKKPKNNMVPSPEYRPEPCTRCIVKQVDEVMSNGHFQKILAVEVVPGNERRRLILEDNWVDADVRIDDVVNVIGSFNTSISLPTIAVTSSRNMCILHPDLLLTATSISTASNCRRKPLLSNLVRHTADVTPALVWGNMLHEVMQACLSAGRWDEQWADERISDVVGGGLAELVRINVSVEQAEKEVRARAQGFRAFAEKYIAETPRANAVLTNTRDVQGHTSLLAITDIHDIEEDIWSPTYGLKGKVDASVHAIISEKDECSNPFARAAPHVLTQGWTMPLEIKTGRATSGMEHRAQTMLYTLLMAERYSAPVPSGLLYYTRTDEVIRVPAVRNEVRALLVARNELAGWTMRRIRGAETRKGKESGVETGENDAIGMSDESFLPPTIDDAWQCGKCYALDTCMLYRKAVEKVVDTSSPIADIYDLKTSHLTPAQGEFFRKWEALLTMEEQDLIRFKKEIWTMGARDRERYGRCFSDMLFDATYRAEDPTSTQQAVSQKEGKIHRFTYRFQKGSSPASMSLLNGHMNVGDPVTVSVEPHLLALARGFIVYLTPETVVIGADHELNLDMIRARLRDANGKDDGEVVFRIDRDELFGGMGRMRDNLAQLFYVDGDARRRRLVVDLEAPVFESEERFREELEHSRLAHLNASQKAAVSKALTAQDYALILGMPGTGKTTIIAALVQTLANMGKTVLLTSYTHSAVDNVLLKLKGTADFSILRLGNLDKIHKGVHEFTLNSRRVGRNLEDLEQQMMSPPVVATTCLSIDHPLFSRRTFDYCIVDEASQITLPTCLGPMRYAERFILVGDHFQLPPLVRNHAARHGGLDISLFRRLSEVHPQSVVDLTEQYRMNEDIMLLSNKLIYSNKLRCGSPEVAKRTLVLPKPRFVQDLCRASRLTCQSEKDGRWLMHLMEESCTAVFVDTDAVPAPDSRVGDLVENKVEAYLVRQIAECLIGSGVRQDQIGVLSLYRQQTKLLSYLLQDRKDIEILTADRSQGRDKECIIISMVRSNDDGQIGDLIKDWRRINVSFTRARSKLIILGSRKTLQSAQLLRDFFKLMDSHGWILRLPERAHEMHAFCQQSLKKRTAKEMAEETAAPLKECISVKRIKHSDTVAEGILRGRPILKDLINGAK